MSRTSLNENASRPLTFVNLTTSSGSRQTEIMIDLGADANFMDKDSRSQFDGHSEYVFEFSV